MCVGSGNATKFGLSQIMLNYPWWAEVYANQCSDSTSLSQSI